MPKRTDIKSILVIGSGPIVIGQACEFDYSGNQALRVLKAEGIRTILINSNPATIMTDPESADAVYIEPLTASFVEKIIIKEKPCALLPTMGGQTALNLAVELEEQGILKKHNVELLGARIDVIKKAENRDEFRSCMEEIGVSCAESEVIHNLEEGKALLQQIQFPLILRPSFTLGGEGGATVYNEEDYFHYLQKGIELSPVSQVLVEESLIGWKEFELEVVRDHKDNVIIVCSIENLDPMGVHTGDSITVAPAQTLSDVEYQTMRDMSIKIIRAIGVETGGSNIQFAQNPRNGKIIVIEMNPRVSRSSALASKATGFPIAKIATKLAIGYTLDELKNDVTQTTPASFEPTIDYVVVKIPRFDFEKFQNATPMLNTTMKSVGEVMSIGGNFKEAMLKAMSSLENKYAYFLPTHFEESEFTESRKTELVSFLRESHHRRIHFTVSAIRLGLSVEEINEATSYDPWFLNQFVQVIEAEQEIIAIGKQNPTEIFTNDPSLLAKTKAFGFDDRTLARFLNMDESLVRELRHSLNIRPQYRAVDTCAAEFEASTPYLYSTYCHLNSSNLADEFSAQNAEQSNTVMILGGGPNRIGQGIEFDYCCVHGSMALQDAGHKVVMINCNPETVSTDFDISDLLFFEPVTAESVIEIANFVKPKGAIVQFGGQTPLKIAQTIAKAGVKILGTSVDDIDLAEDRERCEIEVRKLAIRQPENTTANNLDEAVRLGLELGLPVLVRPSYVLGGRAMHVCYSEKQLRDFAKEALFISEGHPLYLDRFLSGAIELDVDVVADGDSVVVGGIMEHIEEAGIHSGDSSCAIPTFSISPMMSERIRRAAIDLAKAFRVRGLMNCQFAVEGDKLYLIEVNPRASRTIPFVSKSVGVPLAKVAAQVILGKKLSDFKLPSYLDANLKHSHVKGAVFPFHRFDHTDTILGPEMRSTGEVMGRAPNFGAAFAKALIANSMNLPTAGNVFISVRQEDKNAMLPIAKELSSRGFEIVATIGTHNFLKEHKIDSLSVKKLQDGSPNCVEMLKEGVFALVINTTSDDVAIVDSYQIRRTALENKTPCITTISAAYVLLKALEANVHENLEVEQL